jgi:hypothetical protein
MSITLTREQLYQRVWETPIDTLRKEFGISNVGLGKQCQPSRELSASACESLAVSRVPFGHQCLKRLLRSERGVRAPWQAAHHR